MNSFLPPVRMPQVQRIIFSGVDARLLFRWPEFLTVWAGPGFPSIRLRDSRGRWSRRDLDRALSSHFWACRRRVRRRHPGRWYPCRTLMALQGLWVVDKVSPNLHAKSDAWPRVNSLVSGFDLRPSICRGRRHRRKRGMVAEADQSCSPSSSGPAVRPSLAAGAGINDRRNVPLQTRRRKPVQAPPRDVQWRADVLRPSGAGPPADRSLPGECSWIKVMHIRLDIEISISCLFEISTSQSVEIHWPCPCVRIIFFINSLHFAWFQIQFNSSLKPYNVLIAE